MPGDDQIHLIVYMSQLKPFVGGLSSLFYILE